MKRILLFMMTLVLAALGAKAAITISSASVSVGGTTYQGYCISGATEGEIAQLLNGNYEGISDATLNQLKSAEYIKVGSSSSPNVLGDADLAASQRERGIAQGLGCGRNAVLLPVGPDIVVFALAPDELIALKFGVVCHDIFDGISLLEERLILHRDLQQQQRVITRRQADVRELSNDERPSHQRVHFLPRHHDKSPSS